MERTSVRLRLVTVLNQTAQTSVRYYQENVYKEQRTTLILFILYINEGYGISTILFLTSSPRAKTKKKKKKKRVENEI